MERERLFARWSVEREGFVAVPEPDVPVHRRVVTDRGPILVTDRVIRRYDREARHWELVRDELPVEGARVDESETDQEAVYITSSRGGIWWKAL